MDVSGDTGWSVELGPTKLIDKPLARMLKRTIPEVG
jgi:hypothetical protein